MRNVTRAELDAITGFEDLFELAYKVGYDWLRPDGMLTQDELNHKLLDEVCKGVDAGVKWSTIDEMLRSVEIDYAFVPTGYFHRATYDEDPLHYIEYTDKDLEKFKDELAVYLKNNKMLSE